MDDGADGAALIVVALLTGNSDGERHGNVVQRYRVSQHGVGMVAVFAHLLHHGIDGIVNLLLHGLCQTLGAAHVNLDTLNDDTLHHTTGETVLYVLQEILLARDKLLLITGNVGGITAQGVGNVNLVGFPLRFFALVLPQLTLGLVLLQSELRTAQHGHGIVKQTFLFFLYGTVHLIVRQRTLAVHDAVNKATLRLQTLIGGNVKGIFDTEAHHTDGLTPISVQVALALDTAVTLCVVHRTVRSIHVYQQVQTLLHIDTCAQSLRRTENDTDAAAVHGIEYLLLGDNAHAALDNSYLRLGNALRYQLGLDVIVDIERDTAACVLAVLIVTEHGNGAVIALRGFQVLHYLRHGGVGLAHGLVRGLSVNKARVDGSTLGNTIHRQRNTAVLLLLLTCHILKTLQLGTNGVHDADEARRLRQEHVLVLTTFLLRYLLLHLTDFLSQDSVGNLAPDTDKLGLVHVGGKTGVLLELAAGRELQHL